MSGLVFLVFVLGVICAATAVMVLRFSNQVVNVADELVTSLPAAEAESLVAPLLASSPKVDVRMVLPGTYTLSYSDTSGFAWILAVVAFPVGLLAFWFLRHQRTLTISITAEGAGSRIRVVGQAHEKLALAVGTALQLQLRQVPGRV